MLSHERNRSASFSPEFVPVASHPLVRQLDTELTRPLMLQHLFRYLDATIKLELLVVNRVLVDLVTSTSPLLHAQQKLDAYTMICDEGYHALTAYDLSRQLESVQDVRPQMPSQPIFMRRLDHRLTDEETSRKHLAELLFVIVSETLISTTLSTAAAAGSDDGLRAALRDHAIDEGRHHAFFAALVPQLWHLMDHADRQWAGVLVPHLIDDFLAPDLEAVEQDLQQCGLSRESVAHVLHDVYGSALIRSQRRQVAAKSLRYFNDVGAFATESAQDALFQVQLHNEKDETR